LADLIELLFNVEAQRKYNWTRATLLWQAAPQCIPVKRELFKLRLKIAFVNAIFRSRMMSKLTIMIASKLRTFGLHGLPTESA